MKPGKKKLVGKQHMLDKNKDGTISGEDFKMMAGGGSPKNNAKEMKLARTAGGTEDDPIDAIIAGQGAIEKMRKNMKSKLGKVVRDKLKSSGIKAAGGGSMKDKINEAMGYKKGGRVKAKKVGKEKSYKAKSIGGKMSKARGMGAATRGGKFQGVF
jgi:hypothetical protein